MYPGSGPAERLSAYVANPHGSHDTP
jgi:hypothetical protein